MWTQTKCERYVSGQWKDIQSAVEDENNVTHPRITSLKVVIVPREDWGGDGLLGCNVGYG